MSVPEWKKAILKKKKDQEEAEKKKQLEKEKYLASLPPWKRAMVLMKEGDGSAATSTTQTKPTTTQTKAATESSVPAKVPAWKQARTRKDSDEKPTTTVTPSTSTTGTTQSARSTTTTPSTINKPVGVQKDTAVSQKSSSRAGTKVSITQTMKGRFEPADEQAPSPPVFKRLAPLKKVTETNNTPAPDKVRAQAKEQIKDEQEDTDSGTVSTEKDKKREDTAKPSDPGTSNKTRRVGQFEQPSKDNTSSPSRRPNRPSLVKSQAMSIDVNDDKFKTLPKWKQELIRRKHQQKEAGSDSPLTKRPSKESTPANKDSSSLASKNQTSSSPVSKTFPSPPASPASDETNQKESSQPKKPEVVNSSENKDQESPKLLRKEGTELRPPVFKVKSKWADIGEDDPDFKNLPEWKRVLIQRRKNDVKTRTAPIPKPEKEEKKEPKNDPLPEPLWTPPTRSVPVREIPKEPEKEEVNPLADIRKSLRHVNRPNSATRNDQTKTTSTQLQPKAQSVQETERIEAEETISPLKSETDKPKKKPMRRVSWSDTDLNASLTVEFTYPKYSYEDYHEIEQEEELEGTDGGVADPNELATPLHPSLSPPKNTNNSTSQYNGISSPTHGTGSSPSSSEGSSGGGGGSKTFSFGGMPSLGNFMAAYTSGMGGSLGSFSNGYDNTSSNSSDTTTTTTTPEPKEEEQNDKEETVAVVQDENVAALMW